MRRVDALKNQYIGVNAHLHSYWQTNEKWFEFHICYIVYLLRTLKQQLLPMGYSATIESSRQIRRFNGADPRSLTQTSSVTNNAYELVVTLSDLMHHEERPAEYRAIAIYEVRATKERGEPVAWIEILSPANKPGGRHDVEYREKRDKLFDSALVFVEIDFLHESPPTFQTIPAYYAPKRRPIFDPSAHPYHVIVIDPRPMFTQGKAHLYHFDVEMPIPQITIPLSGEDTVTVDLQTPYNRTLEATLFTSEFIDYAQFPINFDRYSPVDQQRIAARMVAVLEAVTQDKDLESGPFSVPEIPLSEALASIEKLTQVIRQP